MATPGYMKFIGILTLLVSISKKVSIAKGLQELSPKSQMKDNSHFHHILLCWLLITTVITLPTDFRKHAIIVKSRQVSVRIPSMLQPSGYIVSNKFNNFQFFPCVFAVDYITAPFEQAKLHLFKNCDKPDHFFRSSIRCLLVDHLLKHLDMR